MSRLFLVILCFASVKTFSQVPFVTYSRPTSEKLKRNMEARGFSNELSESQLDSMAKVLKEELGKPDYLDHYSANIVTLQNGKKCFR